MSQLNIHMQEDLYLITCFMKISEYFVQIDFKLATKLTNEYLVGYLTNENSGTFVTNVLMYMGLLKNDQYKKVVTLDITASLILLDIILSSKEVSLVDTHKLYAFIQLENPKFQFCAQERETLSKTLKRAAGL